MFTQQGLTALRAASRGPMLGLETPDAVEVEADWYERKPWALEVRWDLPGEYSDDGPVWAVAFVVEYDESDRVVRRTAAKANLCPGDSFTFYTDLWP